MSLCSLHTQLLTVPNISLPPFCGLLRAPPTRMRCGLWAMPRKPRQDLKNKGWHKSYLSAPRDGREPSMRVYPPQLPPAPHTGADQMGTRSTTVSVCPSRSGEKRVKHSNTGGTCA